MDDVKRKIEEVFLHFDDELGVFSATGSALAGAGLMALLANPGLPPVSAESITVVAGLALIVLDYFR